MALPTGTTRGSGLSRSEAAILAWKKRKAGGGFGSGALDPTIAARVKEILAEKANKGKKKGSILDFAGILKYDGPPKTIEEMVDFTVGRVLDLLKIEHKLFKRWTGGGGE